MALLNLRESIESDLGESLEGSWGLPVILISPDGETQSTNALDPTKDLVGQVVYSTRELDDEGIPVVTYKPNVSLRVSSLTRVPQNGEVWAVKIPITPSYTAQKVTFILTERPIEDETSIGFIRLYLTDGQQS